jgi:hypothetical protein
VNAVPPSVMLLPLVLMGRITYEEARTIARALRHQPVEWDTELLRKQIEGVLGRDLDCRVPHP